MRPQKINKGYKYFHQKRESQLKHFTLTMELLEPCFNCFQNYFNFTELLPLMTFEILKVESVRGSTIKDSK